MYVLLMAHLELTGGEKYDYFEVWIKGKEKKTLCDSKCQEICDKCICAGKYPNDYVILILILFRSS